MNAGAIFKVRPPISDAVLVTRRSSEAYELSSTGFWRTGGGSVLSHPGDAPLRTVQLGSGHISAVEAAERLTRGPDAEIGVDFAIVVARTNGTDSRTGYVVPVFGDHSLGDRVAVRNRAVREHAASIAHSVRESSSHMVRPAGDLATNVARRVPALGRIAAGAGEVVRRSAHAVVSIPRRIGVHEEANRAAKSVSDALVGASGSVAEATGVFRHRAVDVVDVTSTIPDSEAFVWRGEVSRFIDSDLANGVRQTDAIVVDGDARVRDMRRLPDPQANGNASIQRPPTEEEILENIENIGRL